MFLLRIAELFEIIVDYPESEPALKDLAVSLKRVEMKGSLISSLDRRFVDVFIASGASSHQLIPAILSILVCL